jgi:hypothetical protein
LTVSGGDRRQFGGSNKGEITWIETDYDPSSLEIGQLDRLESLPGDKGVGLEIGRFHTDSRLHRHHLLLW